MELRDELLDSLILDNTYIKLEDLDKKIKEQEAEDARKKEDEILTNNIISVFGDKKFTSDYVKNGLIADIKSELGKVMLATFALSLNCPIYSRIR